jgi:hypothetical protein
VSTVAERSVPIDKLVPNPRNPNIHPEEQIERLMASLHNDGQTKPILARKANMMLIAGHGVRMAARRLGWKEIGVKLLDVDQRTADRIMLGDNRFGDLSTLDNDRVAELLRELADDEWKLAGYSGDEVQDLLSDADDHQLTVREVATSQVEDTFWISVRGPLRQQATVLQRIKTLLAEQTDVEISLGIVEDQEP